MAKSTTLSNFLRSPWNTLARLGFSAIFFFWLYLIWNSTAGLNESIDATTDRLTAIQHLRDDSGAAVNGGIGLSRKREKSVPNQ